MEHHRPLGTTAEVQQAIREHCLEQAKFVSKRADDAVDCLRNRNHLGALGALEGLDQRVRELSTVLKLVHDLSYRELGLAGLNDEEVRTQEEN